MPKGSLELTEKRKNEIIDACKAVYEEQDFQGVNMKAISTALSMTRPAIYHYFETKEEILLGLLIREYEEWMKELNDFDFSKPHSRKDVLEKLTESLRDRDMMLRILNLNLYEIEVNSRLERLTEFKKQYAELSKLLKKYISTYKKFVSEMAEENFIRDFNAFLFGLYPFTHHTEKQLEAMKLAGMVFKEESVQESVRSFLYKVLP